MTIPERRAKLVSDLALVEQQQSRLLAAAQDCARQSEQMRGAIAVLDELAAPDPPAGDANG
jgi:hypothetical protein